MSARASVADPSDGNADQRGLEGTRIVEAFHFRILDVPMRREWRRAFIRAALGPRSKRTA